MEKEIKSIVAQIADILLINGGFLNNTGLFTGEMGLVLFFARYARYTQNELFMEYCFGLIEKIQHRIHQDTPINYMHGLTGIGSTIEYLVQNNYCEANTDEILEDFDQRIFYTYNLPYLSTSEITDIWYYVHWRLAGNSTGKDMIRQTMLPQIEQKLEGIIEIPCNPFRHLIKPAGFAEKTSDRCFDLIANNDFWGQDPSLQNGLAGWGLSLLTELDSDESWFALMPDDCNINSI